MLGPLLRTIFCQRERKEKNLCLCESCFQIVLRKEYRFSLYGEQKEEGQEWIWETYQAATGVVLVRDDKSDNCKGSFAIVIKIGSLWTPFEELLK